MFRSFSTIILFFCITRIVLATSKHKRFHCGENEVLSPCANNPCDIRKCSEVGQPVECIMLGHKYCKKGCICKDEYLRADDGTCIHASQCPKAQCGDNEVFDSCPQLCPGEQCGVDPSVVLCLPSPKPGDPSCQPGCRCRTGYLRNNNGKCIPQNQCQKTPSPPGKCPVKRPPKHLV